MDLGCFHKYIAFYAYINCCKTNSSLKRGNEKVAISNINTIISNDIQKVWNIVLAVDKYNSWRSDLSKTEIINDKQFSKILYLIFDYPHKHYTFKYFEV